MEGLPLSVCERAFPYLCVEGTYLRVRGDIPLWRGAIFAWRGPTFVWRSFPYVCGEGLPIPLCGGELPLCGGELSLCGGSFLYLCVCGDGGRGWGWGATFVWRAFPSFVWRGPTFLWRAWKSGRGCRDVDPVVTHLFQGVRVSRQLLLEHVQLHVQVPCRRHSAQSG